MKGYIVVVWDVSPLDVPRIEAHTTNEDIYEL